MANQTSIRINNTSSLRTDIGVIPAIASFIEGGIAAEWIGQFAGDPDSENCSLSIDVLENTNLFTDPIINPQNNLGFTIWYTGDNFGGNWIKTEIRVTIHNETTGENVSDTFFVYLYKNDDFYNENSHEININALHDIDATDLTNMLSQPSYRKVRYTLTNLHNLDNNIIVNIPIIDDFRVFEENQPFVIDKNSINDDITYSFELTLSLQMLQALRTTNTSRPFNLHLTSLTNGIGQDFFGNIQQEIIFSTGGDYNTGNSDYSWANLHNTTPAETFDNSEYIWNNYFAADQGRRGIMGPGTLDNQKRARQVGHSENERYTTLIPQRGIWLDHSREYEDCSIFHWSDHTTTDVGWYQQNKTDISTALNMPWMEENAPNRYNDIVYRVNQIGLNHYVKYHNTDSNNPLPIPNGQTSVYENISKLFTFHKNFFWITGVSQVYASITGIDINNHANQPRDYGTFSIPIRRSDRLRNDFYGPLELRTKYPITITPNPVLKNSDVVVVTISPPLDPYYWDCMRAARGNAYFKCELYPSDLLPNGQPQTIKYFDWRDDIEQLGDLNIPIFIDPEILQQKSGEISIKISLLWQNSDSENEYDTLCNFWKHVKIGNAVDGYWGTNAPAGENINPPTWWDSTYTASADDRTNDYQFRKDMRTALFDVLDSSVRKWVIQYWDQFARLNGELVQDWSPAAFQSSERVRLIDTWATEILYNIESIFNFFGETQVQALYAGIYSHIQRLKNELGSLVDETVSTSINNLNQIQEILELLQRKVDEQTILTYEMGLPTVPLNQIKVYLTKSDSDIFWDVTDKLFELDNQLIIDFDQLKEIIGSENKKNYFNQWYLRILPTGSQIENYYATNQKTLSANIEESDVNILGASLIDNNGKVYKIINKKMDGSWLLTESIDENEIDKPLTIIYNYFEPQILELKFSWWHNYVPKDIPLGIDLPELDVFEEEEVIEEVIEEQERVEQGIKPNINKEIF